MLDKVVSGGRTGADQAAWRAACAFGIPTGGWMPRGFLTEEGPRPDLAEIYGAVQLATADYRARAEQNVSDADASLWFGSVDMPGAKTTPGLASGWATLRELLVRPSVCVDRRSAVIAARTLRPSEPICRLKP